MLSRCVPDSFAPIKHHPQRPDPIVRLAPAAPAGRQISSHMLGFNVDASSASTIKNILLLASPVAARLRWIALLARPLAVHGASSSSN